MQLAVLCVFIHFPYAVNFLRIYVHPVVPLTSLPPLHPHPSSSATHYSAHTAVHPLLCTYCCAHIAAHIPTPLHTYTHTPLYTHRCTHTDVHTNVHTLLCTHCCVRTDVHTHAPLCTHCYTAASSGSLCCCLDHSPSQLYTSGELVPSKVSACRSSC